MTRDHYETLGVDENATSDEIKRAYRAKAVEHHPDKGGDAGVFADVASAYDVLKDPQRRLLYDGTGKDSEFPIDVEVNQVLATIFSQALAAEREMEILTFAQEQLKEAGVHFGMEKRRLKNVARCLRRDAARSARPVRSTYSTSLSTGNWRVSRERCCTSITSRTSARPASSSSGPIRRRNRRHSRARRAGEGRIRSITKRCFATFALTRRTDCHSATTYRDSAKGELRAGGGYQIQARTFHLKETNP